MKAESSVKVENGKLVKAKIEYGNSIRDVKIRGDFFLEPPESLKQIQKKIKGLPSDTSQKEIAELLEDVEADFIGFSRENVAEAVTQAVEGEEE